MDDISNDTSNDILNSMDDISNDIKKGSSCHAVQTLIEYIKEHCITKKELEKLKIDIENLVNKRLNYGLKQIKEELKEQK